MNLKSYMNLKNLYWIIISVMVILIGILLKVVLSYPELSYLSAIFILLGTLLVTAIDKLINTINKENEVKILTKKVLLTVNYNVRNNLHLIKQNKDSLKDMPPSKDLHMLDMYFWDSVDKRIENIDIEFHVLDILLLLKKCVEDTNKFIEGINKARILYNRNSSSDSGKWDWLISSTETYAILEKTEDYKCELENQMNIYIY